MKIVSSAILALHFLLVASADAQPVTAAEAEALGKQIQAAAAKGDLSPLQEAMDGDEIFARATKGLKMQTNVRAGLRDGSNIAEAYPRPIAENLRKYGSLRYLRTHLRGDPPEPRPLLRLVTPGAGDVTYYELHLFRHKDGNVRIGDILNYFLGETVVQNLRTNFAAVLGPEGNLKKSGVGSARGEITAIRQMLMDGKAEDALKRYERLPEDVRAMRGAALLGLTIKANVGDDAQYLAELDRYRRRFPEGAEADLIAVDALIVRKEFGAALAAIDRLDKRVGGDPYLDALRARVAIHRGDVASGRKLLRQVMQAEPTIVQPCLVLLEVELDAGNFDDVAELLTECTRRAGIKWSKLDQAEPFADFVKSPAYKKWKSSSATDQAKPAK